jgi:signal-transduction protein with cAMP-binding, CBS, and nucleotidyltransferase domain
MHSKHVVTPSVSVVSPGTAIAEIARKMRDEDIGVTLVVERERLVGVVVTDRGMLTRVVCAERDADSATAREMMSPRLLYWSFHDVLANVGAEQVRRLPA